ELFKLAYLRGGKRVIVVVAEAPERNDRINDRRGYRPDAVALFEVAGHPLLASLHRFSSRGPEAAVLEVLVGKVGGCKNRLPESPRDARALRVQHQLADVRVIRNRAVRTLCPHDRQRNYDSARPRRHLIQVEGRPLRKKDYLGGHRRAAVPRILSENREIDSSEAVGCIQSSKRPDHISRAHHMRRIRVVAQELQDKVGFAGSAYFGGTTLVDGPSAFRELFLADVVAGFADPVTFEPADEVHRQDVLGFQDRVAFQLS